MAIIRGDESAWVDAVSAEVFAAIRPLANGAPVDDFARDLMSQAVHQIIEQIAAALDGRPDSLQAARHSGLLHAQVTELRPESVRQAYEIADPIIWRRLLDSLADGADLDVLRSRLDAANERYAAAGTETFIAARVAMEED